MNSVSLSNYHRLYAFSDYGSMKAALPYMRRVVLAKRLTEVESADVRGYVGRVPGQGYVNYLEPIGKTSTTRSADKSFITALQLLYKRNGYSARYVVIERM
ncbi:hypothetical protein [Pontibacter roseus]|uniref:hypothetical protein n=1 Tax=Pontibacter roseus TaxID=336989 RepID=UPI00036FB0DE|nr:hypothetical protein [Pontibacter roseus]